MDVQALCRPSPGLASSLAWTQGRSEPGAGFILFCCLWGCVCRLGVRAVMAATWMRMDPAAQAVSFARCDSVTPLLEA